MVDVVAQHREPWVMQAEATAYSAQADLAATLEAYFEAIEARTHARATVDWLRHFPERAFKVFPAPLAHVGRHDPIPRADLAHGLRVDAGLADPPARTLKEHVEARGLTPAAVIGGPRDEAA